MWLGFGPAGRPDTLQLNYGSPALWDALLAELHRFAHQCESVRCNMAMGATPSRSPSMGLPP